MSKLFYYVFFVTTCVLSFHTTGFAQSVSLNAEIDSVKWQCQAKDASEKSFLGEEVFGKNNAVKSAVSNCQDQSQKPDSCRVSKCRADFECHNHACD